MRFTPLHSKPTSMLAMALFGIGLTVGCTPSASNDGSGGSGSGSGGNGNGTGSGGGNGTGGKGSGGSQASSGGSNGSATGGHTAGSGGSGAGSGGSGTASGGSGTASGGSGAGTGGSGTSTGGSGTASGGTGTGTGGSATGGSGTGTGGTGTGSGGAGGTNGGTPPGWWTSGSWHGCSWTGIDVLNSATPTKNMPQDFVSKTDPKAPYCVSGTVTPDPGYNGVALLGFNLNETSTGSATQCAYKPADPTAIGPPEVTMTGTGIAVSFTRTVGSILRIQIQDKNGGLTTGQNDRWCYTITEPQGPIFAPFNRFNTKCWDQTGTNFDPTKNNIDAIVFSVPGTLVPTPFAYCIGGFATGNDASAAPAYTPSPYPVIAGTLGGPEPAPGTDLDFQRAKVAAPGAGGKQYIIQNNNWGSPASTDQTISYSGNSFTVMSTTGNVTSNGVPASFPSIFIGANGNQTATVANDPPKGPYTTRPSDNLPKAVSSLASIKTTAAYNKMGGDYNATYDIWMAAPPTPPSGAFYSDAYDGFVMVWLYKPSGRTPIGGSPTKTGVVIDGNSYDVYVGPRGTGTNPNRPVVSYVANPAVLSRTFDLKPILMDAASHGIPSSWFVTDIFFGFEIWTGSSASGLSVTNFTAEVQ